MSYPFSSQPTTQHLAPYPALSDSSHGGGDYKASYDELIDEYGSDYAPNGRHQTIAVKAATMSPSNGFPSPPQPAYGTEYSPSEVPSTASKHVDWGYPPSPRAKQKEPTTFWETWLPDSIACRCFVLVVIVETIIDLAIEADLLVRFHRANALDKDNTRKLPVYLSIFALAHVFQLIMALDAVYARNTLQFISLTVFNAVFIGYSIIQSAEMRSTNFTAITGVSSVPVNTLSTMIIVVVSLSEVAYIGLGWKIYNEFGWKVYKFIGADRQMKRMYTNYQVYQCIVKFDFFFFVGFSIMFIFLVLKNTEWEYWLTIVAIPVSIVFLIEGHLAARYENKIMMATFLSGCVAAMVYFVYKLYRVLANENNSFDDTLMSLSLFSVLAILFLITTFVLACLVMSNFGRGLKEQLAKNAKLGHRKWGSQAVSHSSPMSAHPNRMSID